MKTYLVTGGAGFIGSHLVDHLLALKNQVIVVDDFNDYYNPKTKEENISQHEKNLNFTLIRGNICDFQLLEQVFSHNEIFTIVHLAARAGVRPSIDDPLLYQEVNNRGTQNIFELARKYKIKHIVAASSSSVYGNNKKLPFSETDVVDFAISPYAATKKANEVMGHVYHKLYNINMIFLRFFTVYGPRQRPDLAIYKFTRMILNDEPIPFFGDGSTARDYTFIDDIIDGILKAIKYVETKSNIYEVLNLGESSPITLNQMVSTIETVIGKKAIINKQPMQLGDVDITFADIKKAKKLIGYNPQTSFQKGIESFIKWYKESRH